MSDGTLRYWFTIFERSERDDRTNAFAEVSYEGHGSWVWRVFHPSGNARGETTTQKGARAAARRHVRKLLAKS